MLFCFLWSWWILSFVVQVLLVQRVLRSWSSSRNFTQNLVSHRIKQVNFRIITISHGHSIGILVNLILMKGKILFWIIIKNIYSSYGYWFPHKVLAKLRGSINLTKIFSLFLSPRDDAMRNSSKEILSIEPTVSFF